MRTIAKHCPIVFGLFFVLGQAFGATGQSPSAPASQPLPASENLRSRPLQLWLEPGASLQASGSASVAPGASLQAAGSASVATGASLQAGGSVSSGLQGTSAGQAGTSIGGIEAVGGSDSAGGPDDSTGIGNGAVASNSGTANSAANAPAHAGNPLPLPNSIGRAHPVRLTIPGLQRPEVQAVLADFLTQPRLAWFARVYERSFLFRSHISRIIEKHGVPPEIFFIPFIESEFTVSARSSSDALGMWQFMENSMSPWLAKNGYKDERLSFFAATEAGIAKLAENYAVLGDWLLAAAAYNAGLGAVRRAIEAGGTKDFWVLAAEGRLPEQTRRYVPKLLASAAAAAQLGRNGFVPPWEEPIQWTQIMVPAGTSLAELARASGYSLEILTLGNRNLLTPATPPNERYYPVTVPIDAVSSLTRFILAGFEN